MKKQAQCIFNTRMFLALHPEVRIKEQLGAEPWNQGVKYTYYYIGDEMIHPLPDYYNSYLAMKELIKGMNDRGCCLSVLLQSPETMQWRAGFFHVESEQSYYSNDAPTLPAAVALAGNEVLEAEKRRG